MQFRQDVDFHLKRGAKELNRNDPLSAIVHYRKAYENDPTDLDSCLALAELLTQMRRYEESIRILLIDMSMNDPDPESYYGLACNYFGLREFDYAKESLETYLKLEPDGYYAYDAADFLDLLDDEDALAEEAELNEHDTGDSIRLCRRARLAADSGDTASAIAMLEAHTARYCEDHRAKNQLATLYYCEGKAKRAMELIDDVLHDDPKNVHALCNRILLLSATEQEAQAQTAVRALASISTEIPEELSTIALIQTRFEEYAAANATLNRLLSSMPYDSETLHRLGYCRYMLSDTDGACSCYRKLLRIDPGDTVARYYLSACQIEDRTTHRKHWCLPYQVPLAEVMQRYRRINALINLPQEDLDSLWASDRDTRDLFAWALTAPEQQNKSSILKLVASFEDANAERMLRDYLLRTDQPDARKHEVLTFLSCIGAKEPFMAFLGGQWVQGSVNATRVPRDLPAAYANILASLSEKLIPNGTERSIAAAASVVRGFLTGLNGSYPRISSEQQLALAAAIELLGRRRAEEPADADEIAHKYRISLLRLNNALKRIEPYLEGLPCD